MKLSIITPYYNCLNFLKKLASVLEPQLTDEVEWIIIDDGCHEQELDNINAIIIHLPKNTGCAGIPRNYGLNIAQGDYITFIDADDLVTNNFVSKIIEKIDTTKNFDYCFMSWKKFDNSLYADMNEGRPEWNCSVWGVIYNHNNIKNIRFSNKRFAEDYEFNQAALKGTEERITDYLYYYNSNENGLSANWEE